MEVIISKFYLQSHLSFSLVLLNQEMTYEPTPPQAKFCPLHLKVVFLQRSLPSSFFKAVYKEEERRSTHREKVAKTLSEISLHPSNAYKNSRDRLFEWISSEDDSDSEEDIEEAT